MKRRGAEIGEVKVRHRGEMGFFLGSFCNEKN